MYDRYADWTGLRTPVNNATFIYCLSIVQSAGAQDLRVKLETAYESGPQASSSNCLSMSTPTALASFIEKNSGDSGLSASLAASIAPADMLNVWNATKMSTKGGTVNTADGK